MKYREDSMLRLDDEIAMLRCALVRNGTNKAHIVALQPYRNGRSIFPGRSFCGNVSARDVDKRVVDRQEFNANACGLCVRFFSTVEHEARGVPTEGGDTDLAILGLPNR